MPASRWNSNLLEMLNWLKEEEASMEEFLLRPIPARIRTDEHTEGDSASEAQNTINNIPPVLPILPLRGLVVYPETAVPLTIGQPRSIRLVDDVMGNDDRMIGLVASRDPDLETPEPADLYTVGTVAIVHRLFRAPDGSVRLVVQGITRFRLGEFIQTEPYLKAQIELIPETLEDGVELEALARNARDQFEHIADMIPSIPRELVASVLALEDPLETVYT
ncbi:MAG TPA: LON peptidase substrate-binding domain-containing protein, partial [Anaerolineales bacterium]|nr:LON peptidase substrate-binding domain-containing protein [Anaerolineales bacterium]